MKLTETTYISGSSGNYIVLEQSYDGGFTGNRRVATEIESMLCDRLGVTRQEVIDGYQREIDMEKCIKALEFHHSVAGNAVVGVALLVSKLNTIVDLTHYTYEDVEELGKLLADARVEICTLKKQIAEAQKALAAKS